MLYSRVMIILIECALIAGINIVDLVWLDKNSISVILVKYCVL